MNTNKVLAIISCVALWGTASSLHASGKFFLNAGGGFAFLTSKVDRTHIAPPRQSDSTDVGGLGGLGRIGLGYDYFFCPDWFCGLEFHGSLYRLDSKTTEKTMGLINNKFKHSVCNSFGAALRAGYQIKETTSPYLKIGITSGKFEIESNSGVNPVKASTSKRKAGLELGCGVDFNVTDSVALGVEFDYYVFRKIKFTHTNTANFSVNPCFGQILFNLKYMFPFPD